MKSTAHYDRHRLHSSTTFFGVQPKNSNFFAPSIQRQQTTEEEDAVQPMPLMRKTENSGYQASPKLTSQLSQSKGGGNSLPTSTLSYMNKAFGTDFSYVRVHTSSEAQEMSQGIQAKAFTHGSDIYFSKGQYSPDSSDGKELLAHELTHVVQQRGNIISQKGVQRSQDDDLIPKITWGDWEIPFPKPTFETDDRYDNYQNRERAERKDEDERRVKGDAKPHEWWKPKSPLLPERPKECPSYRWNWFMNYCCPKGKHFDGKFNCVLDEPLPIFPLPKPVPSEKGDVLLPDPDQRYA